MHRTAGSRIIPADAAGCEPLEGHRVGLYDVRRGASSMGRAGVTYRALCGRVRRHPDLHGPTGMPGRQNPDEGTRTPCQGCTLQRGRRDLWNRSIEVVGVDDQLNDAVAR